MEPKTYSTQKQKQSCTDVEWPLVWNELKIEHGGLVYCMNSQVAVLVNGNFLGGEKEFKEFIENKYVYHLCLDYYREGVGQFTNFIRSSGRPCVYMHISINDEHMGTMIFLLYADLVPRTCENFLRLCREKRGGYSGTPIHRIVKDGWIQCGGYSLKQTDLDCENFIVPHDRRGVLCMANDGRHIDCSTQFFVLLQPAPWMEYKYVAFGMLIEGDATLKDIENLSTWYESPISNIRIYDTGILNTDCQDIIVNKETREYILLHIENLTELRQWLHDILIKLLYEEIEQRRVFALQKIQEHQFDEGEGEYTGNIHATQRFNKEDIEKQLEKNKNIDNISRDDDDLPETEDDVCEYKPEEFSYQQVTPPASLTSKPEIPYYIPLTDVIYPGEVTSSFDLKKFLKGDYCLEGDLLKELPKEKVKQSITVPVSIISISPVPEIESLSSMDSEDEEEIQRYIKTYGERVSYSGNIIKSILKRRQDDPLKKEKSMQLTDENLRRVRLLSSEHRNSELQRKVSIYTPTPQKCGKIKRRQTGFIRPKDLERLVAKYCKKIDQEEETKARKVRIVPNKHATASIRQLYVGSGDDVKCQMKGTGSDICDGRPSVLARLYEDISVMDEELPTLKDYKPISEIRHKNTMNIRSPTTNIIADVNDDDIPKYRLRHVDINASDEDIMLNIQYGQKSARKVSSDYVKVMNQSEYEDISLRTADYAKSRPRLTIEQYRKHNKEDY